MGYRLPPLNALRLFEAAGRHLSFRLAAEELHVTPSAVSHAIQSLEAWLGLALFRRAHRSLSLTEAGADYLPQVRQALALIATASESLPRRQAAARLAISVAPSFGLRWLLPKLPRFRARHPAIEIALDTAQRQVDFARDGIDLAIRMGRGGWPGLDAVRLVGEELVPVAAPAVAARIASAGDLATATLLHVVTVAEDWQSWCGLRGVTLANLQRGPRFDSIHMALEAAAEGLGVALGRWPLIAGDVAAGRLVPVLQPAEPCATAYWLVGARGSLARPEAAAFRDWLGAELAA